MAQKQKLVASGIRALIDHSPVCILVCCSLVSAVFSYEQTLFIISVHIRGYVVVFDFRVSYSSLRASSVAGTKLTCCLKFSWFDLVRHELKKGQNDLKLQRQIVCNTLANCPATTDTNQYRLCVHQLITVLTTTQNKGNLSNDFLHCLITLSYDLIFLFSLFFCE